MSAAAPPVATLVDVHVRLGGPASRPSAASPELLRPASRPSAASPELRGPASRPSAASPELGDEWVLRGVDLTLAPGAALSLMGPSGGGKSTLLRLLVGLAQHQRGSVEVVGGAGLVFQDFRLFPHLTALENVALAPERVRGLSRAAARERAAAWLERVGLGHRLGHHPSMLSGGQQQRVAIARALALEPRLLLCDEVTSALDPEARVEVMDVLVGVRDAGVAVLAVTHQLALARRLGGEVAFLFEGRVGERGPVEAVLGAPREPRTARFLESVG